ncbi:uncharacterized protein LOC110534706 isoform X2 [Oncorhynchus mykiss]|uniref:uncharacterized protein LOC110534706 isoform X2 n=1 Tax=Oncorhynchus mykiss TaxID=8022 RepID=UPI00187876CE|nr:uncharacterized protein LOC110534706 isoform X2 [Oncorhynchus mykiss]
MESADTEAAGPGVKQERSERKEDLQHSINIQTGTARAPPIATEDSTTAPAQPGAGSEYLPSAGHEDLLISSLVGGREWTSEVAGHKPWPWIRTLDQEPSLFLPESEPGPNHKGQRLHHHTEHNQWTGGLNNLSPGGHQRDRGSSDPVCSPDPSLHSLSAGMEQSLGLIDRPFL